MTIRTQWAGRVGVGKQGWRAGLALAAATAVSALVVMASAMPASAAPPVLVFDAHANGGSVTSVVLNAPPAAPSNLSCTTTPGSVSNSAGTAVLAGLAVVIGVETSATGTVDGAGLRTATAQTETANVLVLGSIVTASSIQVTATATGDDVGNVTTSGSALFTDLKVNGVPIPSPVANTSIGIPGIGTAHINEQVTTADGKGITVNAIRLHFDVLDADIVVGHARASLTAVGDPCPIN